MLQKVTKNTEQTTVTDKLPNVPSETIDRIFIGSERVPVQRQSDGSVRASDFNSYLEDLHALAMQECTGARQAKKVRSST